MKFFSKIKTLYKGVRSYIGAHPLCSALLISLAVTFLNEILSRRSLISAVVFVFTRPLAFISCFSIVLVFESLALLSKRRKFMIELAFWFWLGAGIINFVLQSFRTLPFSFSDIAILPSVLPILEIYITPFGVIALIIAIILLLAFMVYRFIKAKKYTVNLKLGLIMSASSIIGCIAVIALSQAIGVLPDHFSGLQSAYIDYGFNYCFTVSATDKGMDRPDDYNENISQVVTNIDDNHKPPSPAENEENKKSPNIVFVQLESFYDIKKLNGFEFSIDPCPNFTALKKNCQSGYLTVPSIGTGTINTEFEVISGMSTQWFGAGEFPYETILRKTPCESICYDLEKHGYSSHAVHNYRATFYHRDEAFTNLGFDTFTPIEYMNGYTSGWKGWASDDVLTRYITASLDSTPNSDFVYCISVQCHGIYPTAENSDIPKGDIEITAMPKDANEHSFSYFADQLYKTDKFIGELTESLSLRNEETIVVFFGDHIPNIGIEEEWLPSGSTLYDTEYVIWRNYSLEDSENAEDGENGESYNLKAYQLSSEIMAELGIGEGYVSKLHQMRYKMNDETYHKYLEMLQYDILYGYRVTYGGELPYKQKNTKFGAVDIEITAIEQTENGFNVIGKNFTRNSIIYINDDRCDTEFISEEALFISDKIKSGDRLTCVQHEATFGSVLGKSKEFVCK